MKAKQNLHLKVQELCDCFAETDPLKEMSDLPKNEDRDEAALKWLALATLHGINSSARKISISRSKNGDIKVFAKYRKTELPTPGPEIGGKIFDTVRKITHLEGEKGKTPFSLGVRDGSLEVTVKIQQSEDKEKISVKFPG